VSLEQSVERLEARCSPTDDGGTSAAREALLLRLTIMQANLVSETRPGALSVDAARLRLRESGAQLEEERRSLVAGIRAGMDEDSVGGRLRRIRIGMLRTELAARCLADSEAAAAAVDALRGPSPQLSKNDRAPSAAMSD